MNANARPLVTVAIPCLDEERFIVACLEDVLAQDLPMGDIEVLVADGMSRDRTRFLVERAAPRFGGRLRLLDNPRRVQAAAMNAMLREAKGEIVVRMDVHARYAPDYVRQCVQALRETGAANVGGAQRPVANSLFGRALCAALASPLAVGGARYRHVHGEGYVDTVFLGAFRRETLEALGGYDEGAVTNEDAELNQRILQAGGRIYLSPKIVVHYTPRSSLAALFRQYLRYGRGRARTVLKHRSLPTVRPLGPFLLVLLGALFVAMDALRPFAAHAVGLYAAAAALEAVRVARHDARLVPLVALIFPIVHLAHGLGFAAGLAAYALRPDWGARAATGGGART